MTTFDVVIIGGAFSGGSAGLLLKRALPHLRVLIVERTTVFDKKVGESTSEVGGAFLTRVLKLGQHLYTDHINKHGLRLWFTDGENECPYQCSEIGPRFQSRLPTYQLDRSVLDEHVLQEAAALGCEVWRPATVRGLVMDSGEGSHQLTVTQADGTEHPVSCRWVLDASGRRGVLAKHLGIRKYLGEEHPTSAVWARFRGVNDLDSHLTRRGQDAFANEVWAIRSVATNHLTGRGWWCWLIPLSDGTLSAGIVWDRRLFQLPPGASLASRLQTHLLSHPVGRLMFAQATPVEDDTHSYKDLAYYSESNVGNRWALLGDAAGFIDPLYSQGLDYCGHTISAVTDLIIRSHRGECTQAQLSYLQGGSYGRSYRYWFEALYKDKYHYLGDMELMWPAFLMDLGTYFIGPVRLVYSDPGYEWTRFPYDGKAGSFFAGFMKFYNSRLAALAEKKHAKGLWGDRNVGHRHLLADSFTPDQRSGRLIWQGIKAWIRAEVRIAFAWNQRTEKEPSTTPAVTSPQASAAPILSQAHGGT